ncbi:hypothetical protein MANAM107_06040 [Actinomyces capricornis]|uniref:DUF3558 domain-containing protein n=2 Tax=Actinomyces capricornis TaxID=2755559 RepID=A0ABN6K2I4_9ACTO|nr:hypothetical protein MANAM107_06040 [Actinomyces capricornis]
MVRSVGSWCLSVGAVVALGISGCAEAGRLGEASPSPKGLPEDVKVCGFLKPSQVEEALGVAVKNFSYSHYPGDQAANSDLYCGLATLGNVRPIVRLWYEPRGNVREVLMIIPGEDPRPPRFDDLKDVEGAELFAIDGVEGEGVALINDGVSYAVWRYPDDHVLIVEISFSHSKDITDQRPQAKALLEASVNGVVEQAAKPKQKLTAYPPDSGAPAIEYATPNPG